jgi:hypothetical protein
MTAKTLLRQFCIKLLCRVVTSDGKRPAFAGSRFEPFVKALLALRKALWHHGLNNERPGGL